MKNDVLIILKNFYSKLKAGNEKLVVSYYKNTSKHFFKVNLTWKYMKSKTLNYFNVEALNYCSRGPYLINLWIKKSLHIFESENTEGDFWYLKKFTLGKIHISKIGQKLY